MYIFNISYNSLLRRQILSHLLGIGGEVLSIEHINEYFKIVGVVSGWFVGLTSERFSVLNV